MAEGKDRSPRRRNLLILSAATAAAIFLFVVTKDPFREVRALKPVESWGEEDLIVQGLPPSHLILHTSEHARVFRFTQDPITVFTAIGGKSEDIAAIKEDMSKARDYPNMGVGWYRLPIRLRSGREGAFRVINDQGQFTCKLVIRPIHQIGFGSIFDLIFR